MEGVAGLGAALISRLATDGIEFVDVPAKLAAWVRLVSSPTYQAFGGRKY
ncbi:MAG: hypothetical protein M3O70_21165 [Actinomycetota bacterium]|nr:hypothetical protein [Actinomycetota bacterium]